LSIGTHVRRQQPSSLGGKTFTKWLFFVFKTVIGCSKAAGMIFPRKAAEAVSRFLSCDKADRKSSFLPLFFQTPFARNPAAKSSGIFHISL
jgi:hypothetical protein